MKNLSKIEIASMIDHTLLSPFATRAQFERLFDEAAHFRFASVCVNPAWIPFAVSRLRESSVAVCAVVGFPLGADQSDVKAFAASRAVLSGASEIDMVMNISFAKEGRFDLLKNDIAQVVQAAKSAGKAEGKRVVVKVILETCYLTDFEIKKSCACAREACADFVKTSTGFATPKDAQGNPLPNGANASHVALMKKCADPVLVKASGGIRTAEFARTLIEAGASRLGTSSGVAIVENW